MAVLDTSSLANVALFRDLAPDTLARLEESSRIRRVAEGELILTGDRPHDVYVVLAGGVEILCPKEPEGLLVLAELQPGECCGEFAAIDGDFGSALARAGEDTVLLEIPRPVFARLLREEPSLSLRLLEHTIARVRDLNQRVAGLAKLHDDIQRIQRDLFMATL